MEIVSKGGESNVSLFFPKIPITVIIDSLVPLLSEIIGEALLLLNNTIQVQWKRNIKINRHLIRSAMEEEIN